MALPQRARTYPQFQEHVQGDNETLGNSGKRLGMLLSPEIPQLPNCQGKRHTRGSRDTSLEGFSERAVTVVNLHPSPTPQAEQAGSSILG